MSPRVPRPDPHRVVTVTIVAVVLLSVGAVALTGGVPVTGTITLDATDGPAVALDTGSSQTQLATQSAFPDNNTVDVTASQGNATFSSAGNTSLDVVATELTGTRTRVTTVRAPSTSSATAVTVDPADKRAADVGVGIDAFAFRDATVGDGAAEFDVTAPTGGTIVLRDVGVSNTPVAGISASDEIVATGTVDASGTATLTIDNSTTASDVRLVTGAAPVIGAADPSNNAARSENFTLAVELTDADFARAVGDNLTVEFIDDRGDVTMDTDTLTSNGTATGQFTQSRLLGGPNSYFVNVTDQYGNAVTSQTFDFQAPDELIIRNESAPSTIVTTPNTSVSVTFFGDGQTIERTTSNGRVDMTGLPLDVTFTAQVDASGFVTRQTVVPSILEQQDVYLLPDGTNSVGIRFVLQDPTGQFATESTRVVVKKPITRNNQTEFDVIVSDVIGVGGYSTVLERDQRYLLEVRDTETGAVRSLGPYVSTQPEEVTLTISALDFENKEPQLGYEYSSTFENDTAPTVTFAFSSDDDVTVENLQLNITSQDGNLTLVDTSFSKPGTIKESAIVPSSVDTKGTVFVVEWSAEITRDGSTETVGATDLVGPGQLGVTIPQMSQPILSAISVLVLLMVGGLFSQANVAAGGIITSLTAGGLYLVGALPGAATGLLVATALVISIIAFARTNQQIAPQ